MLAMHTLEHHVPTPLPPFPALPAAQSPSPDGADAGWMQAPHAAPLTPTHAADGRAEAWTVAQAAVIAHAEAIAAEAAREVAAEAAVTAQAAVDAAAAAALRAIARAEAVAARAALAAEAAAHEILMPHGTWQAIPSAGDNALLLPGSGVAHFEDARARGAVSSMAAATAAATAAAQVASRVAAVAAAAAVAALQAETLVREQLAQDESAMALQLLAGAMHADPPQPTRSEVPDPLVVAEELRYGISADELRLHYQPIMNLVSCEAVGVEALVRWQHPVRGLLNPVHFIDIAEDTGLILPLGAWVLHEACRMAVALQDRPGPPLTVAVNLSGRQLSDPSLLATVRAALDAHGCQADRLVFEVTETALVTDMSVAVASLRELRRLGAGVALDDFGTGYAPLLYLKHLAAHDLKIDRSFVSGLGKDLYDTAIVASLIAFAHNLDIRCVAEGVETVEQLTRLTELGCDFAQGYLFSRPTDAQSLHVWLDRHLPAGVVAFPPPTAPAGDLALTQMAAMHRKGDSRTTIAAALNAEGSRSASGRRWSPRSVTSTLALALAST